MRRRHELPRPQVYAELIGDLAVHALKAVDLGQPAPTTDVGQLMFELDSPMLGANVAFAFFTGGRALDRARAGHRRAGGGGARLRRAA